MQLRICYNTKLDIYCKMKPVKLDRNVYGKETGVKF